MDKRERIAVVGGGLSGLAIAEQLQKKGYEHVTVFEKTKRAGGKLDTICYRGKTYEFGALFGLPDQKHLKKLMKMLKLRAEGPKVARVNYDAKGNRIMQIPKEDLGDFIEELDRLPDVLAQYQSLEEARIVEVEADLMLSFTEWCRVHDFRVLESVYAHYFTSYGLGYVERMPAIYVLRILSYSNLMSFMDFPKFSTWSSGVSILIDGLVQRLADLRLGQGVKEIQVKENGKIDIRTEFETLEFDRVVIAAPLEQFSSLYAGDAEMVWCLNQIQYHRYNVYAFLVQEAPKGSGCILENLNPERNGHVVIWYSRWEKTDSESLFMVYAYDDPERKASESLEIIKEDLLKMGIHDPKLYMYRRWKQCPHVGKVALRRGFYEKVHARQGEKGIYFAGEILSTVSMDNCIWHAEDLVNRYF